MQLHQLKPIHKNRKSKRVGRGGKRGTYSSRGMKGQKSRAGRKFQPIVRELIKRYPKLRGYRFKPQEGKFAIVNTADLEKKFQTGEKVSPKTLLEKGLIEKFKNKMP
ncbi:MAG: 50S ribosomal protein L15, partial [Candidatus Wildermuthbacteria bacterium RIFCSPLOWO2_12_FULL_40_9]